MQGPRGADAAHLRVLSETLICRLNSPQSADSDDGEMTPATSRILKRVGCAVARVMGALADDLLKDAEARQTALMPS